MVFELIKYGSIDKKVTDACITTSALRKRCIRIKLDMDSTITIERGVGVSSVGVGGRRRTRRIRKERKNDTIRHDKETDRYSKTDATGDHDYLFCSEDRTQ